MLLSVCIPTFNRSRKLLSTLSALDKAADCARECDIPCDIEVLIGDNASSDDTQEVVASCVSSNLTIKYTRRPENIGCERNWLELALSSLGDYCWILSDDDVLSSQVIVHILRASVFNPSLIFIDYAVTSQDDRSCLFEECKGERPDFANECALSRGFGLKTFFEHTRFRSSFISSNVFSRESIIDCSADILNAINFPYVQLKCAELVLGDSSTWVSLDERLINMKSPSLLQSRSRALQQGYKHFYFDSWLQFSKFVDQQPINALVKANILSELWWQILYEKHSVYRLSASRDDLQYWLSKCSEILAIPYFRRKPQTYTLLIGVMLAPAWVGESLFVLLSRIAPCAAFKIKRALRISSQLLHVLVWQSS